MSHVVGVPSWVTQQETQRLPLRHVQAACDDVQGMTIREFETGVRRAYESVFAQLDAESLHAVRFWAFLPGIHDDMQPGLSRYMVFNTARYLSYQARFGGGKGFRLSIPSASAVGVDGDRFALHCLGSLDAGEPVENPRQVPAYQYSERFGPNPPCFARATLLSSASNAATLLVAGTSSITGESSRHHGDLTAQFLETLRNLAHVVARAGRRAVPEGATAGDLAVFLNAFRHVRVYHVNPSDAHALRALAPAHFVTATCIEFVWVSLCRPELLVEIEGLAVLS